MICCSLTSSASWQIMMIVNIFLLRAPRDNDAREIWKIGIFEKSFLLYSRDSFRVRFYDFMCLERVNLWVKASPRPFADNLPRAMRIDQIKQGLRGFELWIIFWFFYKFCRKVFKLWRLRSTEMFDAKTELFRKLQRSLFQLISLKLAKHFKS